MSFFDEPFTAVDVDLKRVLQDLVIAAAARELFSRRSLFRTPHRRMTASPHVDEAALGISERHFGQRGCQEKAVTIKSVD